MSPTSRIGSAMLLETPEINELDQERASLNCVLQSR
jgi:hypothetical protein